MARKEQEQSFGAKVTSFVKSVVLVLTLVQALALFVRAVPTLKRSFNTETTADDEPESSSSEPRPSSKRKQPSDIQSYDPFQRLTDWSSVSHK